MALTRTVYSVPLIRDGMVSVRDGAVMVLCRVELKFWLPDFHCRVYSVMALPPSLGAPQLTVSCWWPDPACTLGGASGGPTGVPVVVSDGGPSPTAFTAITRAVYTVPLVSPVMA